MSKHKLTKVPHQFTITQSAALVSALHPPLPVWAVLYLLGLALLGLISLTWITG
jgi:hypothetical protein